MNKVIVITGPTAVGKTKLSIEIAKKYNGEIINCDADIMNIVSYMLCKNTCWDYEKEWRIIIYEEVVNHNINNCIVL